LLFIIGNGASQAGVDSVLNLVGGSFGAVFWIVFIAIGLVIPIIIEWIVLFGKNKKLEESVPGRVLAGISDVGILVGGYSLRILILLAALPITLIIPWS
ncbi:MAG: polysulfide reductase, partial [Eggerthellaceae bacterium]|nr:polysulfide reductase [Eggerthellaceae bacterium]